MTVKEAGEKWSIGSRMVILYRVDTRILREQRNGQYAAAPQARGKAEDGGKKVV